MKNKKTSLENFIIEFILPSDITVKTDKNSLITITNTLNYVLKKFSKIDNYFTDNEVSTALLNVGFKYKIDSNEDLGFGKNRLIQATYFNIDTVQFGFLKLLYKGIPKNTGDEKKQKLLELERKIISFDF